MTNSFHKKNTLSTLSHIRGELLVCLFLGIVIFAVYWQVISHDFVVYDDLEYVAENNHIQNGLCLESALWSFTAIKAGNWHPLTWLSHIFDVHLYGMDPGKHHLTSLILHVINSMLLFLVLKRMTGALWKSSFAAALFALHPLHVESVAWVAERKDVLSTLFWILTMWSYLCYVKNPKLGRYLLILLCFVLGLMAKPMLVTLPFVLLLLDYWPLKRFEFGSQAVIPGLFWKRFPCLSFLQHPAL